MLCYRWSQDKSLKKIENIFEEVKKIENIFKEEEVLRSKPKVGDTWRNRELVVD